MKYLLMILLIITLSVSAESQTIVLTDYLNSLPKEEIDEEELEGILLMREEEKLAQDVYKMLFEKWNAKIFQNIASSETMHMDWVKVILDKYNIADPMKNGVGVYEDEHLTELYNALLAQGNESLEKAYYVGCTIEDLDISDLLKLLIESNNNDIKTVYQNLLLGSRNHLRSFDKNYKSYGLVYLEQFITKEMLSKIINNPSEKGPVDQFGNPLGTTGIVDINLFTNSTLLNIIPNPSIFSDYTSIQINVTTTNDIGIKIYNLNGELIKNIYITDIILGENTIVWDGTTNQNTLATNGSYYIILWQENHSSFGKVIINR